MILGGQSENLEAYKKPDNNSVVGDLLRTAGSRVIIKTIPHDFTAFMPMILRFLRHPVNYKIVNCK